MTTASATPATTEKKTTAAKAPLDLDFNAKEFLTLLGNYVGQAKNLQNNPPALIPKEDLVADQVIDFLTPYSTAKGGPLKIKKVTYVEGRSNVVIEYPADASAKEDKTVSFIGSHMDVVAADPDTWTVNPFALTEKDGKLYGRGVTDCLGHVALFTSFFKTLAEKKPKLNVSVFAVFIANEENSSKMGIGIDEMEKQGELKRLKNGPVFWVDSADFGPTLGTASAMTWEITATGKLFHSGLPQKGINALELGVEAVRHIQERFYKDFPYTDSEMNYKFLTGSTLKPTMIKTPPGSINQIPGECVISGDIRGTPFYSVESIMKKVESYVTELDVTTLPSFGWSKFELKDENKKGSVSLKWIGAAYKGIAVNMKSKGYAALLEAITTVRGEAKPFSLGGSLPLIKDLQDAGFDVQMCGFGRMAAYHAVDEFAYLSEFEQGTSIIAHVVDALNKSM